MLVEAMNSSVLTTDKSDARTQVRLYNEASRVRSLTAEEKASLTTLRQLKKGKRIIDIYRVFKAVASDAAGRPVLAIANAAWKWCHFYRDNGLCMFDRDGCSGIYSHDRKRKQFFPIAQPMMAGIVPTNGDRIRGKAIVPTIPPNLRPTDDIENYHILFEAEWQDVPVDPILLRAIKGTKNLFVVLAHWNLTETERAVLAGRFDMR